jgi:tetratricopeptide (TPR) repeat protein
MSARSVDDVLAEAVKDYQAGNYEEALALLPALLKTPLSPSQELNVVLYLSACYRFLDNERAALPHAQRYVALAQQLSGPRSLQHALALKGLCMVHTGLKTFPTARAAIMEAMSIMDELGEQQNEQYGGMLRELGRLEREEGPLAIYDKAKAVLVRYKEGKEYGVLINSMAICHQKLHQWNEAIALKKEGVEHHHTLRGSNHPEYAAALNNLAVLFAKLKQYEEAIPRFEEALSVFQRFYGPEHQTTLKVARRLAAARELAQHSCRDLIDVGHGFRMCNQCGNVKEKMDKCNGCARAWYCDTDCQLKHWPTHQPLCNVCFHCGKVLTNILHCPRCKKAKYCNSECQRAHWRGHKKDCKTE